MRSVPDTPGIAGKVFSLLATRQIVVDMIIQNVAEDGRTDLTFTVPEADLPPTLDLLTESLGEIGARDISADSEIAKVSVVGVGMRTHAGVASQIFETLADANINIQMISTSDIKVSCVIGQSHLQKAVEALHKAFALETPQPSSK